MRVEPTAAPARIEHLEGRLLLSWATAPIPDRQLTDTIYVDQQGNATLSGQTFSPAHPTNNYAVYFDDPGSMTVEVTGAPAKLALYMRDGQPTKVGNWNARTGVASVTTADVQEKTVMYLSVQPQGKARGPYTLVVHGVPHAIVRPLDINPKTQQSSWVTTISSQWDADDFQFVIPKTGDWIVTVTPKQGLDATIIMFDDAGNPIAGSYTKPIDAVGVNQTESWIGQNLLAGHRYVVRIDGKADSTGWYVVRVQPYSRETLNVVASQPLASANTGQPAVFTVRRTGGGSYKPNLAVHYSLGGSATNGVTYAQLSGTLLLKSSQKSTSIVIKPLPGTVLDADKTVLLTLTPGDFYSLGQNASATATIRARG